MNNGVYDQMKFPTYEYRPFPKYAKLSDGREMSCANEEELAAFLASDPANNVSRESAGEISMAGVTEYDGPRFDTVETSPPLKRRGRPPSVPGAGMA